jgi:hypothetical protein
VNRRLRLLSLLLLAAAIAPSCSSTRDIDAFYGLVLRVGASDALMKRHPEVEPREQRTPMCIGPPLLIKPGSVRPMP